MILPLLLIFCPFIVAEPFVYVHPVNPRLHPKELYPIRKSLRGFEKIRDLPRSGIVYLNRIKPISEEFKGAIVHGDNSFVRSEVLSPLIHLQARSNNLFETNNDNHQVIETTSVLSADAVDAEETSMDQSSSSTTPSPNFATDITPTKIAIEKSPKSEEEYDSSGGVQESLMHMLNYITTKNKVKFIKKNPKVETIEMPEVNFIEKNPKVETIEMPETVRTNQVYGKQRHGRRYRAKLVPLSRTVTLHTGEVTKKRREKKVVQFKKTKSHGQVDRSAAQVEFDPWERLAETIKDLIS